LSAAHVSRTRARPRSRHCASPAASIRVTWPCRRHGVVPDVAAHLDQFRGELMADDQGAQVVLAGDVPEDGGRHVPADLHSAPDGAEALEVVAGSFQPLRRVPRSRQSACSPTRYDTLTSRVGHTSPGGSMRRITAPVCPAPGSAVTRNTSRGLAGAEDERI
jgi:hypothetical protein